MNRPPIAAAWSEDAWVEAHQNCGQDYECLGCGRRVCTRCEPSPGEPDTCSECYETEDPEAA